MKTYPLSTISKLHSQATTFLFSTTTKVENFNLTCETIRKDESENFPKFLRYYEIENMI